MSIKQERKIGSTWEQLNNVANTTDAKEFYEEGLPLLPDISASEVFGEAIPAIPPELAFGEESGVVKRVRMALTLDNTVNGNRAWVAVDPWQQGWSSGDYDINQVMNRWISKKHGNRYLPKFFGGVNGTNEIPPLDTSNPVFSPRSGVLTFGSNRSENGLGQSTSVWIEGYIYVGKMMDEMSGSADIDIGDPVAEYKAAKAAVLNPES